jgi:hypothetical protein
VSNLYFAAVFAAVFATVVGGAFLAGIWWESQNQAVRHLEDYKEGAEDAQDATSGLPDDDSGSIKWLREYLGR